MTMPLIRGRRSPQYHSEQPLPPTVPGWKFSVPAGRNTGDTPPSADSKPKYKTLKKKMAQEFKQIHEVLAMNLLPGEQLVQSFIENSALMLSYQKYKGLYYSVYQSAYEPFKKAVEAKDLLSTKALYQELDQIKG